MSNNRQVAMTMRLLNIAILLMLTWTAGYAHEWTMLPQNRRTVLQKYFTSEEAYKYIINKREPVLFIDIRDRAEINYLGMPTVVTANIPYHEMNKNRWDNKKSAFGMEPNRKFVADLTKLVYDNKFTKHSPIILICRSGTRSAAAVNELARHGYSNVYTIVDGFEGSISKTGSREGQRDVTGWKNSGLPWSYKLAKEKMYRIVDRK